VHSPAFWWTRKAPEPVSRAGFRMPGGVPVQQGTWCGPRRSPPRSTRPAGVASAERRCVRTCRAHWGGPADSTGRAKTPPSEHPPSVGVIKLPFANRPATAQRGAHTTKSAPPRHATPRHTTPRHDTAKRKARLRKSVGRRV
jgi:hypothetical protein